MQLEASTTPLPQNIKMDAKVRDKSKQGHNKTKPQYKEHREYITRKISKK